MQIGTLGNGVPILINEHVAKADLRIVTGFIEPHFFAGFSGGPKGIMPGVAGLATIMSNHGAVNGRESEGDLGSDLRQSAMGRDSRYRTESRA